MRLVHHGASLYKTVPSDFRPWENRQTDARPGFRDFSHCIWKSKFLLTFPFSFCIIIKSLYIGAMTQPHE